MDKAKLFFKKHYKKLIAVGVLAAVALFVLPRFLNKGSSGTEIAKSETTLLSKREFVKSINETGKAVSENNSNVYAEKPLPVKEIKVAVGDKVKKGDVIAILDNSSIVQQIEQKEALISSTSRTAGIQIKTAKDRLNEALRNKNEGTNAQILSSQNAVQSAYDSWQNAEKTYENFANSLKAGYNETLASQGANDVSLKNSRDSAVLNYSQAQDKLNKLGDTIIEKRHLANQKSMELGDLKARDNHITKRIADVTARLEQAKSFNPANPADPMTQQQLDLAKTTLANKKNELEILNGRLAVVDGIEKQQVEAQITLVKADIASLEAEIQRLQKEIEKQTAPTTTQNPNGDPVMLQRELESLQSESQFLKEKIAEVTADMQKFKGEVEAAENSISSSVEQLEQNRLQLEINERNINSADKQKDLAGKNMENTLATHRKNADDLKRAYEMAVKNLEVAKIAANDEITALRNSLNSASASGDNTINKVDMKYLKEDLEKAVIKAPMDGTITNLNMIIGQAPTAHVAKIETVDRLIIETKVKEFDINNVKIGMDVEITSDAIGQNQKFKGTVESIDPTPTTTTSTTGTTTTNEVAYAVKVALDSSVKEIKPGMNVRVKYILDKKSDVFVVPSNAVYEKNSKSFVLVINDKDIDTIREVEVENQGNNEFETVVSSNDLNEKIRVINSPDVYSNGTQVKLVETKAQPEKK